MIQILKEYSDKLLHFLVLYFIVDVGLDLGFKDMYVAIGGVIVGGLYELIQKWTKRGNPELLDFVADIFWSDSSVNI